MILIFEYDILEYIPIRTNDDVIFTYMKIQETKITQNII